MSRKGYKHIQKTKLYKFVLFKAYFDKGYSWLSYPKYIFLLLLGADTIASGGENMLRIIILGLVYLVFCFILGKILYKKNFVDAEFEVGNVFNPFVREMRSVYCKRKV